MADPAMKTEPISAELMNKIMAELLPLIDASRYDGFTWKHCQDLPLADQVEIMEIAREVAQYFLDKAKPFLKAASKYLPAAARFLAQLISVSASLTASQIEMGFRGATGAGKSSLNNAIIDHEGLLPTSGGRACTSVCVDIVYNEDPDPNKAFRAIVEFIRPEDWRDEIEQYRWFLDDDATDGIGEGEEDSDWRDRMAASWQKIKAVYPHLKTTQDFAQSNTNSLLQEVNVKSVLGNTDTICSPSVKDFSDRIRPYIGSVSSSETGAVGEQWPLVHSVRLEVKSEVLKNGVCLVDLPGSFDANEARCAAAREREKNLTITCIVAPMVRAADEKSAHTLLDSVTRRNLEMDNQFNSKHFCFIVTKCDDFNRGEFMAEHKEYRNYFKEEDQKIHELKTEEEKVDHEMAEKQQSQKNSEAAQKQLKKTYNKIATSYKKLSGKKITCKFDPEPAPTKKKRKTSVVNDPEKEAFKESEDAKRMMVEYEDLRGQYESLTMSINADMAAQLKAKNQKERIIAKLQEIDSEIDNVCIKARSELVAERLREKVKETETKANPKYKKKADNLPLPVFCTSSAVYMAAEKGLELPRGFTHEKDSGIHAVRQYITHATLENRRANCESFLEAVVSYQISLESWLTSTSIEFRMTDGERKLVQGVFDRAISDLALEFSNIVTSTIMDFQKIVQTGVFAKMKEAEKTAYSEALKLPAEWKDKAKRWNTFKKICKMLGEWTTKDGKKTDWNEDLASPYIDSLKDAWIWVFSDRLPQLEDSYTTDVEKAIGHFVKTFTDECLIKCPGVCESLESFKESALRTERPIQEACHKAFSQIIRKAARDAHRALRPVIKDALTSAYKKCTEDKGKGVFDRSQKALKVNIKTQGKAFYKKGSAAIKETLEPLSATLQGVFGAEHGNAINSIKEYFEQLLRNHTLQTDRETSDRKAVTAKEQLRREIDLISVDLKNKWSEPFVRAVEFKDEENNEEKFVDSEDEDAEDSSEDESSSESGSDVGDQDQVAGVGALDEVAEASAMDVDVDGNK